MKNGEKKILSKSKYFFYVFLSLSGVIYIARVASRYMIIWIGFRFRNAILSCVISFL